LVYSVIIMFAVCTMQMYSFRTHYLILGTKLQMTIIYTDIDWLTHVQLSTN